MATRFQATGECIPPGCPRKRYFADHIDPHHGRSPSKQKHRVLELPGHQEHCRQEQFRPIDVRHTLDEQVV